MIDSKIGTTASSKKTLKRLANKCEKLSRKYTALRDPICQCADDSCQKTTGLDWAHAISQRFEKFRYNPINTMRLNHECHLAIDHSPEKKRLMDELMFKRLSITQFEEWTRMRMESFLPFKPTIEWYEKQIEELTRLIAEVQHAEY
jgi:hypothetical protein